MVISLIRVNIDNVIRLSGNLRKFNSDLVTVRNGLGRLRYSVDRKVLSRRNINERINSLCNSISDLEVELKKIEIFIDDSMARYSSAEKTINNNALSVDFLGQKHLRINTQYLNLMVGKVDLKNKQEGNNRDAFESLANDKDMDSYNKILGHADKGNKQAVKNLSSVQIKELSLLLEADEGFWAPIRNNEVVNQFIRKAINKPNLAEKMDNVIGSSPALSRFYGGVGAVDAGGNVFQPKEGGNVISNGLAGIAGDLAKYTLVGMPSPIGLGFGSTEKVANELIIKGTGTGISGLSKAAQIVTKMASSGAEMGYVSGIDTIVQGGTLEDTLKATGQGVLLGGTLRGIRIGIKHVITPKIVTEGASKASIGKTGEGIPLEQVKPDVLKQIHTDDNGAYGYLPNEGTAYNRKAYDFTDTDWTKEMQNIRKDYLEASKRLEIDIERMTSEGFYKKEIANHVVDVRNQQKVTARANMTVEERSGLEARNTKNYENPIGPDLQWLYNDNKKKLIKKGIYESDEQVWETIIQKSMKKDDVINTLLGLIH